MRIGCVSPHHVNTLPSRVRAMENWLPHLTLTTSALKFVIDFGALQLSLPPRPSLPKSPSPHDHTVPVGGGKDLGSVSVTVIYTVLKEGLGTRLVILVGKEGCRWCIKFSGHVLSECWFKLLLAALRYSSTHVRIIRQFLSSLGFRKWNKM